MSKVWLSRQIRSTIPLVIAFVAGSCSSQRQPVNWSPNGEQASTAPEQRIPQPVANQPYPDEPLEAQPQAILSVPADAFPQLPDAIGSSLRERGCTIPQPSASGPPRNVIRGDFF